VLGVVLEAKRANAEIVAFVRDADGNRERANAIENAVVKARQDFPEVEVIGGTAVPVLEGWLLAILGVPKTEKLSKRAAQSRLREHGVPEKDTAAMARVVFDADLAGIPGDATSLGLWLERATEVLGRTGEHG
jgi:hypothetical protein